jgi:6-pyruvoyl-tetrahydropterin synthase
LDHRNINELEPFTELQPSAENLAKYVLERVASKVGDERVQIYKFAALKHQQVLRDLPAGLRVAV